MDYLRFIQSKIIDDLTLVKQLAVWHFQDQKIVFTNGCFDILHKGHIEYLATAASLGDHLILGLNNDDSVRRLKGPGRPVQDENARAMVLAALSFVSCVVIFKEDTPYELIRKVQPDILVKGADYKAEDIVGYDIVKARGGEVVTVNLVKGYSTTSIINRMNS